MLFIRRYHESTGFQGFLGGHLKFFHYASHIISSKLFDASLFIAPETGAFDDLMPPGMQRTDCLAEADAYFLAGRDWLVLDRAGITTGKRPVVNLIQGFAHLMPGDPRRDLLSRPALRVCVSTALYDAVKSTGLADEPLVAIENATDVRPEKRPKPEDRLVFVAGFKNGPLASDIAGMLVRRGLNVRLQTESLPRTEFLDCLRVAEIAVLLPLAQEGFFLPALEAMALGCAVVIPRCDGARSFCVPEETALVTAYTSEDITNVVLSLHANPALIQHLRRGGFLMSGRHSPERERSEFLSALRSYLAGTARLSRSVPAR